MNRHFTICMSVAAFLAAGNAFGVEDGAWRQYLKPAVRFLSFLPRAVETASADPSLKFYGTGESGHWAVQSSLQVAAGLAILSTVDARDLAAAGSPYTPEELRSLALSLFRYSFRTHLTGDIDCTDGGRWGRHWISVLGLERSCEALDALEACLTDDDRARLKRLLVFESDYRLEEYPIRAGIWTNNVPESNIWNAGVLFRTAFNYPDIPQRDAYVSKARRMMLNGLTFPGDASKPWFVGANFTENWALNHHDYMNVGYTYECLSNLAFLYFNFRNRGQPVPDEMLSHVRDLWNVCKGFTFPDGRLNRIGGDTRFRYGYCQIFAFQAWAFCALVLGDADCERFASEYLKTVVREQEQNTDGSFFGRRLRGIRDASWYYYCRAEADPFFTMCYQMRWHRNYRFPEAEWPIKMPASYTWEDNFQRAAYIKTPRSVRSVVGRSQCGKSALARKPNIVVAPAGASDLAEWQANLVGWIGCQEESDEYQGDPADWPVDSCIRRMYRDGDGDAFEQTLVLPVRENSLFGEGERPRDFGIRTLKAVAIGDGATLLVRDRVDVTRAASLEYGFRALHWLVPNDFANGGSRTFSGRTFCATCDGVPQTDEILRTGERVLTVDDKMSVVAVRGADLSIRRPVAPEIAFRKRSSSMLLHPLPSLRVEEVMMDFSNGPIRVRAGSSLYDVIYIVSACGRDEAIKMCDSVRMDGDVVSFGGCDGRVRAVDMSIPRL